MSRSPLAVTALAYSWPHHSPHSGYHRLVPALRAHARVHEANGERQLPDAAVDWLAQRASRDYGPRSAALELTAVQRLWTRRADVCHFIYGEDSFRFAAALTPGRRGALVATYHNPRWWLDVLVPDRRPLAGLDAVIVVARTLVGDLAEVVDPARVFYVPHGIDTRFWRPPAERLNEGRRALFVGEHMRDFETLVAVARELQSRAPEIRFDAVTSPGRLEELNRLPNVHARSGVPEHALLEAYQAADLLVVPLIDATANNAILEGMSCGLPIVTTDVPGVRDYVDPRCAALVPKHDAAAMSTALVELARNADRRAALGAESRRRALSLDWEPVAAAHVEVYREALRRRGSAQRSRVRRRRHGPRPGGHTN